MSYRRIDNFYTENLMNRLDCVLRLCCHKAFVALKVDARNKCIDCMHQLSNLGFDAQPELENASKASTFSCAKCIQARAALLNPQQFKLAVQKHSIAAKAATVCTATEARAFKDGLGNTAASYILQHKLGKDLQDYVIFWRENSY